LNSLLETLSAYVRGQAPIPNEAVSNSKTFDFAAVKVGTDVEAAIKLIARTFGFELRKKISTNRVDLRNSFLPFIQLPESSDMRGFDFSSSVLVNSQLWGIDFSNSVFAQSNLYNSHFPRSNLTGTKFSLSNCNQTIAEEFRKQIKLAYWDPQHPPLELVRDMSSSYFVLFDERTKEIRENGLWEEYLADREKGET